MEASLENNNEENQVQNEQLVKTGVSMEELDILVEEYAQKLV